ncbi:large conductance mechanosensitive channel protein MscL [Brachybacterium sp. NBEC-018]|uniref:large conductance mechanosensitive channel protein MscL n=1 Tax=Brachybacterium sp. NBEC-018 TaxID=2996004 RepID=UPI002174F331|nr:large conductance mechanosensitive channel protein MscL [Brachybacterium sp. NBEC-018]UVY83230.1 large conductance mechanosensitive channel protein MscL [Brachybacterium sp. NBEC-018]
MKGFKDFVMQGNVIDLAVGVVIGGAFTALVTGFVDYIINPVVAAAGGSGSIGLGYQIIDGNENTFINVGALISAIITFLITAAVVYFVFVLPINRAREFANRNKPAEVESAPEDIVLLTEIRDALRTNSTPQA